MSAMILRLFLLLAITLAASFMNVKAQGDSTSVLRKFSTNFSLNYTPMEASYFAQLIEDDIPYGELRSTYMGASGSYFYKWLFWSVGLLQGQGKKAESDTLTSRARQYHLFANAGLSPIAKQNFILSLYTGVRCIGLRHFTDDPDEFGFFNWSCRDAPMQVRTTRLTVPVGVQATARLADRINARIYAEYQFPIDYYRERSRGLTLAPNVPSPIGAFNVGVGVDYVWDPRKRR